MHVFRTSWKNGEERWICVSCRWNSLKMAKWMEKCSDIKKSNGWHVICCEEYFFVKRSGNVFKTLLLYPLWSMEERVGNVRRNAKLSRMLRERRQKERGSRTNECSINVIWIQKWVIDMRQAHWVGLIIQRKSVRIELQNE